MESLTDTLKKEIKRCGMTRYQLWKLSGVEQSILSRFMAGKIGMTLETADPLCRVLKLRLKKDR